jgi:hypothetical protein
MSLILIVQGAEHGFKPSHCIQQAFDLMLVSTPGAYYQTRQRDNEAKDSGPTSITTARVANLKCLLALRDQLPTRMVMLYGLFVMVPSKTSGKHQPVMMMDQRQHSYIMPQHCIAYRPLASEVLWLTATVGSNTEALQAFAEQAREAFMEVVITIAHSGPQETAQCMQARHIVMEQCGAIQLHRYESVRMAMKRLSLSHTLPPIVMQHLKSPFMKIIEGKGIRKDPHKLNLRFVRQGDPSTVLGAMASQVTLPSLPPETLLRMTKGCWILLHSNAQMLGRLIEQRQLDLLWFSRHAPHVTFVLLGWVAQHSGRNVVRVMDASDKEEEEEEEADGDARWPLTSIDLVLLVFQNKTPCELSRAPPSYAKVQQRIRGVQKRYTGCLVIPVFSGWLRSLHFRSAVHEWYHQTQRRVFLEAFTLLVRESMAQPNGGDCATDHIVDVHLEWHDAVPVSALKKPGQMDAPYWGLVHASGAFLTKHWQHHMHLRDQPYHRFMMRHSTTSRGSLVKVVFIPRGQLQLTQHVCLHRQEDVTDKVLWRLPCEKGLDTYHSTLLDALESLMPSEECMSAQVLPPNLAVWLTIDQCRLIYGGIVSPGHPQREDWEWYKDKNSRFVGRIMLDITSQGAHTHLLIQLVPARGSVVQEKDGRKRVCPVTIPVHAQAQKWLQPLHDDFEDHVIPLQNLKVLRIPWEMTVAHIKSHFVSLEFARRMVVST